MAKFKVILVRSQYKTFEVEANDKEQAIELSVDLFDDRAIHYDCLESYDVTQMEG